MLREALMDFFIAKVPVLSWVRQLPMSCVFFSLNYVSLRLGQSIEVSLRNIINGPIFVWAHNAPNRQISFRDKNGKHDILNDNDEAVDVYRRRSVIRSFFFVNAIPRRARLFTLCGHIGVMQTNNSSLLSQTKHRWVVKINYTVVSTKLTIVSPTAVS